MTVYRTSDRSALRLVHELGRYGIPVQIERYGPVTYVVAHSDRSDLDRLVRSHVSDVIFVPELDRMAPGSPVASAGP